MIQILTGTQAPHTIIPITPTLIRRPLNLRQMRHLMQRASRLILRMASRRQRRQSAKIQRAVNHQTAAGECIRQHTAGAGTEYVTAVVAGHSGGGTSALASNTGEGGCHGGAGRRGAALEVLGHFGGGAGGRSGGCCCCEGTAVGEGVAGGSETGACAVGLDDGALLHVV